MTDPDQPGVGRGALSVLRSPHRATGAPAGPDDAAALDVTGLTKSYRDTAAVHGVDLRVPAGQVHGLIGPNGAGKTTLLGMVFGLVSPDAGMVRLFGRTVAADGARALDPVAGFIEPRFYPYLSGRANLEILADLDGGAGRRRIDAALSRTDLTARAGSRVGGWSLGMRQRLAVAAALLRRPRLLVLDEPTNGLDPAGTRDFRALVRELAADGVAVLLSSHAMDDVADLADAVTVLRRGRVAFSGSAAELRQRAPDPEYRMRTSDDERALAVAGRTGGVRAAAGGPGGLTVRATQDRLDGYVLALGRDGVAVRGLELATSAVESLFFALTADAGPAVAAVGPVPSAPGEAG